MEARAFGEVGATRSVGRCGSMGSKIDLMMCKSGVLSPAQSGWSRSKPLVCIESLVKPHNGSDVWHGEQSGRGAVR